MRPSSRLFGMVLVALTRLGRRRYWLLGIVVGSLLVACCRFPGSVKPTVKIGLSAPFEGRYRDLGYEVLYAVRLAVKERNESGGVGDRYLLELVALNDFNETDEAVLQAREMAADPGVLGVLGGWSPAAAAAAALEYERLGLAFLAPEVDFRTAQDATLPDARFAERYRSLSGGVSPGAAAVWAYEAANHLLDSLDAAARAQRELTRASILDALADDS